jgi:signal transduction histidine kinase
VRARRKRLRVFTERTGIVAKLTAEGTPDGLDEERQTALYRVTQEALVNAGRHGGATRVDVDLLASGPSAELRVRDDGEGFQPAVRESSGLGLQGMAERARLVGGELDVRSAPGAGTEVTMRLP